MTYQEPLVHKKTCPHCGKRLASLNKFQVISNYTTHEASCKENPLNKKKKDGGSGNN